MTKRTKDLFPKPPRVALISIKPRFVDKILSGEKRLEFRRIWAVEPIDVLIIYASSPVRRIVAKVNVVNVTKGSPTLLWRLAQSKGGGLTRKLLYDYLSGKKSGYAIELSDVIQFAQPIDPKMMFENFLAPQSFRYLSFEDYDRLNSTSVEVGR